MKKILKVYGVSEERKYINDVMSEKSSLKIKMHKDL